MNLIEFSVTIYSRFFINILFSPENVKVNNTILRINKTRNSYE